MPELHPWKPKRNLRSLAVLRWTLVALLALPAVALAPIVTAQDPPPDKPKGTYYDKFGDDQREGHGHGHGHGRRGAPPPPPEPIDLETAPRVLWTNPEGGSWSEAGNWSSGKIPGKSDHAIIDLPGSYTVVLDIETRIGALSLGAESGTQTVAIPRGALAFSSPVTIGPNAVLQLSGGRLTGGGDLLVHGAVEWSDGSMSGRGTARIAPEGRIALVGDQRKVLSLRHIENAGTLVWSGAGNLVVTFDARIVNQEGANFEISSGALLDVYGPVGPEVHNAGTLRVVSDSPLTFEAPLVNTGTLDLEAGGLKLLDGYSGDGEVLGRDKLVEGSLETGATSAR